MFTLSPPFWGAEAGDPYWSFVKTLLHFDGNTTDSSTAALTYFNSGTATIGATGPMLGTGCLDTTVDATGRCFGSGAALALSTSDFCIETLFYDPSSAGASGLWLLEGSTSSTLRVYSPAGGTLTVDLPGTGPAGSVAYAYAQRHHSAVTKSGNNWTHWFNGVAAQTWTNATADFGTGVASIWVGSSSSAGTGLCVLMDEFRVTVGVPRYTAPFTPPSAPFPNRGL